MDWADDSVRARNEDVWMNVTVTSRNGHQFVLRRLESVVVNYMLIALFGSCWDFSYSLHGAAQVILVCVVDVAHKKTEKRKKAFGQANKGAAFDCLCPSARATMGLVSFTKVILPAFAGTCVVSYAFWDLARNRKIFGGTVPHTIQDSEWEKETNKKMDAWPREAAGPVVMNPISRQNYRKS